MANRAGRSGRSGRNEALVPILRAAAEIVGSRPVTEDVGMPRDAGKLVEEHAPFLLRAIASSPGLRKRVAAEVGKGRARPSKKTLNLAALLLHPDIAVVEAAMACFLDPLQDRAAERASRTISELRQKLKASNKRLEYARDGESQARRRLEETGLAMAELAERNDHLTQQLAIAQHRLRDPHAAAAALLAVLEEPPSVDEGDAASRDPHNLRSRPTGQANDELLAAARAGGLSPEDLLRVLRAIVAPPPAITVTAEHELRVTPLGGGTEIGGSCVLVEAGGTRILVDAGLRTGEGTPPPAGIERALEGPLDAVVVTHAHNDHCGYVPVLAALRPGMRVLGTGETVRIMPVMWSDTAKLMCQRAQGAARWGGEAPVLYGRNEIDAASLRCEEIPFGVPRTVGELTIELFPAGHILGAAGVVVRAGDRRVVITGDISGFRQESVGGYALPESAREADLLVLETTCCGEDHNRRDVLVGEFVRSVQEICDGGGRVLVPAFALGRAQEIALLMRRHLPDVPVRVDGMAVDLSRLFEETTAGGSTPLKIFGGPVAVSDRPAELGTFTTGVIISTSGMLTGGPAVQWAARVLPEAGSALFISGYQDEESPGASLRRLTEDAAGAREFTLLDHDRKITVPVRARVATMRLSAHADRNALLDIADEVAAREIMLVHGVPGRQRRFREVLRVRDHSTTDTTLWRTG